MYTGSQRLRKRIAQEAANLLYSGAEKEYKQAKLKAAQTLQFKVLPTNLQVAIELDKIAEETEGAVRQKRLVQLREEALKIMRILATYKALLIGSVWRGTIRYDSDIDILVYHDEPKEVLKILEQNNVKIMRTEWVAVTKKGKQKNSFHIYAKLSNGEEAEIKIASSSDALKKERCEIYGDVITGLSRQELEKMLKENPTQRFLPS